MSDTLKKIADNLGVGIVNGGYLSGIAQFYGVNLSTSTDLMKDILTAVGGDPATSTDYLQDIVLELGGTVINDNWMEGWEDITASITPPQSIAAPVISGTTTLGSVLTTTNGGWNNSPTSYAYQWKRAGANIGSNSPNYILVLADSGAAITCVVTATNAGGSTIGPSSNTITAGNYAPVNTVAPVVSGNTYVGDALTTTNGTWTGSPTFTYQWYTVSTGDPIVGATSTTYTLLEADAGTEINCQVTGTNAVGSSMGFSNTITTTVLAAPYEITAPTLSDYTICGIPGNMVTIQSMVLGGNPVPTLTYNWQGILDGGSITDFGQYTNTLFVDYSFIGWEYWCQITATNSEGVLIIQTPSGYAQDCS